MAAASSSGHLTESTLYKEDAFERGHTEVWGSWYDTSSKHWGYGCCHGLTRASECPLAKSRAEARAEAKAAAEAAEARKPPPVNDADISSGDLSADSDEERKARREENPLDWSNPPLEILPREKVGNGAPAAWIEHVVRFLIGAWRRELEAGFPSPGFGEIEKTSFKDSLADTVKHITPLIRRLQNGTPLDKGEKKGDNRTGKETRTSMEGKYVKERPVLESIDRMVSAASERNYKAAHGTYMTMAFGNKMWNLTFIAHVSACTMKGAREYRRNRDTLNTYDMDPVSQKYMWALKKLIHFCQCIRPNDDHSLNVVL